MVLREILELLVPLVSEESWVFQVCRESRELLDPLVRRVKLVQMDPQGLLDFLERLVSPANMEMMGNKEIKEQQVKQENKVQWDLLVLQVSRVIQERKVMLERGESRATLGTKEIKDLWDQRVKKGVRETQVRQEILVSKETRAPQEFLESRESVESKASEEPLVLMADQVGQVMRVCPVQWGPQAWRENKAFLERQDPEVYLAQK